MQLHVYNYTNRRSVINCGRKWGARESRCVVVLICYWKVNCCRLEGRPRVIACAEIKKKWIVICFTFWRSRSMQLLITLWTLNEFLSPVQAISDITKRREVAKNSFTEVGKDALFRTKDTFTFCLNIHSQKLYQRTRYVLRRFGPHYFAKNE